MAIVPRKRKDGSFGYQVKVKDADNQWFDTPTFDNELDAKAFEVRLMEQKRKGKRAIGGDARKYTTDDYWDVWSVDRRMKTSAGWRISQDQMYRDYVKPVLGSIKMFEVDQPAIGRVLQRMQKMQLSDQMREHVYSLMRGMFGDAAEYYEMISKSPVNAKFHRPKVNEKARSFLMPEQSFRLLEDVRDHAYLGAPIWVQILSALRVEAVQGLAWSAVQWELDQILICRAWKQKEGVMADYPKGKDWEYVPMPPLLKEYLLNKWNTSKRDLTDFVCPGIKGGMLPYETYLHSLRRACRKAGVPVVTPHELRHSSTEIWIQAGASQEDIRRLLNHASSSTTSRYIHRTDTRLQSIANELSRPGLRVVYDRSVSQNVSHLGNFARMPGDKPQVENGSK